MNINIGSKLHRHQGGRKQVARGLLRSLFEYGKVETSEPRGKTLKSLADRLLHTAKKDTLATRKKVASVFAEDRAMVKRVFDVLPDLRNKKSGFTKLIRLGRRLGDGAERVRVELIKTEQPKTDKPKSENRKLKTDNK